MLIRNQMSAKSFIFLARQLYRLTSARPTETLVSTQPHSASFSTSALNSQARLDDLEYLKIYDNFIKSRGNTVINICSQNENIIVERLGKFQRVQGPGLFFAIPFFDRLKYCVDIRELTVQVRPQHSITQDNVSLNLGGVVYFQFTDPYKCAYGVSSPVYAVIQYAQSAMRAIVGRNTLDEIFHNREELNKYILQTLKETVKTWGINVLRYEITEVEVAQEIKDAMSKQASAERKRREDVLHAEALKRSQILESEGLREKLVNESLGNKTKVENEALAFAEAVRIKAEAERNRLIKVAEGKAKALEIISAALGQEEGKNAASLELARNYIDSFGKIAEHSNSIIIPEDLNNVSGFIAKALSVAQFSMKNGQFGENNAKNESNEKTKKK